MFRKIDKNDDRKGERNSRNKSCTDHPDQTTHTSSGDIEGSDLTESNTSNMQTRVRRGQELKEFNRNYRRRESQVHSQNSCGSPCQEENCRDPNCRSYWNIPLTPCAFNKKEAATRLSKENRNLQSNSRRSLDSLKPSTPTYHSGVSGNKTHKSSTHTNPLQRGDKEKTNLPTSVRRRSDEGTRNAPTLKNSLISVQQRRQEGNIPIPIRRKSDEKKKITSTDVSKSTKTVKTNEISNLLEITDKLATIQEEIQPECSFGMLSEMKYLARYLPVVSLVQHIENTFLHGVKVQEIDIGQPCLGCERCKGYEAHSWRKNCRNCKCPRDNHAISEFAARSRIGFSSSSDALDPRTIGYTFVPSGLTKTNQVAQYYSLFPSHEVPKIGSEGEIYRSQRLVKQLPKQDLSLTVCKFVEPNQKGSYQDFVQARNEIALDIGFVKPAPPSTTCENCEKAIPNGQYCVAALKMGDLLWHPTCFRCTKCDDLLVDLAYCVYKDKIYCERHYAECLKPRCEGCDELIFSGEYTKAMNKDWHGQHFCCWQCDESLTGQRYVLRDDHPYCVSCYESVFANACEKCSRTIGIDSKDLSYKDKHWHEACFLCTTCGESLVDKQFGSKGERIYCGRCYDNQFASRCDGCNEIFRAGTKKMEYKTRQWHEKCFCCCVCKVPIGTQSFIPREQEIYCAKCYEEKFATRCIKCNKVITSGGVTYKNEPWHRECFTCTHCSKSLAGERFTSREEKPYCAECFGELFAKRCFACNKPITGIGGTKFISFEDRHWHNDCFFCAMCRASLVGRGFITDQDDIICPECAKQKLL